MYETFFDLTDLLCQRYTALTPFIVRREKFREVMRLVRRINNKEYKASGAKEGEKVTFDKDGNKHIWREAGDDFW